MVVLLGGASSYVRGTPIEAGVRGVASTQQWGGAWFLIRLGNTLFASLWTSPRTHPPGPNDTKRSLQMVGSRKCGKALVVFTLSCSGQFEAFAVQGLAFKVESSWSRRFWFRVWITGVNHS